MSTENEKQDQEVEVDSTQTVGDIMKESTQKAIRTLVILAGVAVYVAGVVYAEVHGFSILSKGVASDFLMWAYVGMVALGITAIALPLALHVWTFGAMHRIAAFIFYALDIGLLGFNSFVDFGVNTGETLPQWAQMYKDYLMPATPVVAALGWSILFLLDPATKALIQKHTLRASIRESLSQQIIQAAKSSNVTGRVNAAARLEVDDALTSLFGTKAVVVERRQQAQTYEQTTAPARLNMHLTADNRQSWIVTRYGTRTRMWCLDCRDNGVLAWTSPDPCEHVYQATAARQVSLDERGAMLDEILQEGAKPAPDAPFQGTQPSP